MSRFRKLSQTVWHCQYHIVWCPKYRFRVLQGDIKKEVEDCIRTFTSVQKCELIELNVQADHVHLLVMVTAEDFDIKLYGNSKRPNGDPGFK